MKFEQAQISRKLVQATASHRKLAVKRGTSVHKLKTCDDLRSCLIRALYNVFTYGRQYRPLWKWEGGGGGGTAIYIEAFTADTKTPAQLDRGYVGTSFWNGL